MKPPQKHLKDHTAILTWLSRYQDISADIQRLTTAQDAWKNQMSDILTALTERLGHHHRTLECIQSAIDTLPDPRHRQLLRARYLEGHSWNTISREMHYTRQQIYNLKMDALDALEHQNSPFDTI
ncbi:MAG: sigma factor-like helix-turn-helix DNA-binding protein [Christensenella sp.]|uniref:sigma factor-like helix-turn-helix DNA-binding protein n=1 Tax=Christensenella sp. TaxID=1935934 RepID=UPI002B21D9C6|nr:sigma factor-like helix-turn-helix DNA-binding protein [Christensenella sp.]MEA5003798.1 sigma factor-like helix-turn-helix DNA-binding protein [Christensenella sp.]